MNRLKFEELFEKPLGGWDFKNPEKGHQDRFLKKLQRHKNTFWLKIQPDGNQIDF